MLNTTGKEGRGLPRNPSLSVSTSKGLKDDASQVVNAPVDLPSCSLSRLRCETRQAWASHRQVKDDLIVAEECLKTLNVFDKNMPFTMKGWLRPAHRTHSGKIRRVTRMRILAASVGCTYLHENCLVHIVPGVKRAPSGSCVAYLKRDI